MGRPKKYAVTIRTIKGSYKGERMTIKGFESLDEMHKFLNTGDNSLHWRQTIDYTKTHAGQWGACDETKLKPGAYAWAAGSWHSVKGMDPTALAHL